MNKKEYNKDRYDRQRDIILEKVKVYADNNKEKISLTKKIAYQRSKEKRRIYNISKKFGISEEEYQMLTELIVAKHRNGALGRIKEYFHNDKSRFTKEFKNKEFSNFNNV